MGRFLNTRLIRILEFELCKSILKMRELEQIAILGTNSKSRGPYF